MKIVIGYDGSDHAGRAVDDLRWAGIPAESEVRVVAVADGVEDARATATGGATFVRTIDPAWTVSAEGVSGSAATAIVEHASDWRADLIVVGSHGHGAIRRAVLGSVSQSVLRHARCSVRVARSVPRTDEGAPLRVLLGIDGSPAAAAALNAVSMRRWPAGTELRVVVAVDVQLVTAIPALMPDFNWTIPVGADELHAWPRQAAAEAVEELRRAGISAASIVRDGDPTQVLLEEADSHRAACIFLGARGHSRLESLLLGSVSASVAARANCSVEVVRFE